MSYVPVRVDLRYGGQWHEITDRVYGESRQITVQRGASAEGQAGDTTSVDLQLKNGDGTFSTRNPESPLYGLIGRNTQLRVGVGTPHPGASNVDITGTTSHVAPSVDAPTDDALLICVWACPDAAATYTVPGSMTADPDVANAYVAQAAAREVISAAGATGTRTATVGSSTGYTATSVLLHGDGAAPTVLATAATTAGAVFSSSSGPGQWVVMVAHIGWDDPRLHSIAAPDYPVDNDGGGWILLSDTGVVTTGDADVTYVRMKAWAKRVRSQASLEHLHNFAVRKGDIAVKSLVVSYYRLSGVGQWEPRATVEVPSWPTRRDSTGNERYVPVRASGVMRRLGRDRVPVLSTMHREVAKPDNAELLGAYWPVEDESGATSVAAAVRPGVLPMQIYGTVRLGSYSGFGGSRPIAEFGTSGRLLGKVVGMPTGVCYFRYLVACPSGGLPDGSSIVDIRFGGGTIGTIRMEYTTASGGSLNLQALSSNGAVLDQTGAFATAVDGRRFFMSVEAVQDGSALDVLYHLRYVSTDGVVEVGGLVTDTFGSQTLGRALWVDIGRPDDMDGMAVGHVMIGTDQDLIRSPDDILTGYVGERAGDRLRRLCAESDVPFAALGDPATTVPMGAERSPATLMQLLRDCETADMGFLTEPREFVGLGYLPRRDLYNRQGAVTLDYAQNQLVPPFQPEPDDFQVVNHLTVRRAGGSSATAIKETGPLNVSRPDDDPQGVGPLPGEVEIYTQSDGDLIHQAGWRLRLGTVDEPRFQQISTDLVREQEIGDADLPESLAAVDIGDRLLVTNPPTGDLAPDDVDQMVVGYQESLSQVRRRLDMVTVPWSPHRVLQWQAAGATPDPDAPARYDSGGSTVASSFDAGTETSLSVTVATGHPLWTTESAALPLDIMVSGARLRVTAISGASSPQTMTVQPTPVNGVVKTIPAGEPVRLFAGAAWAL